MAAKKGPLVPRIIYNGVPLNGLVALKLKMQNTINVKQNLILEGVAFEMAERMQARTPFKTGVARSNWSIARDRQNPPFNPAKKGRGHPVDTSGIVGFGLGKLFGLGAGAITIDNKTPYIVDLEFGSSKQAPAGMMRITTVEMPLIAKQVAARLRGKGSRKR